MAGVRGHRRIAARYRAPRWLAHLVAAQAIPAASRCRRPAVASITSALRPGGWLLAEDPDFVTPLRVRNRHGDPGGHPAVPLLETVSGGIDSQYARRLPADLAATTSSTSAPRTGSTKFKVAHPLRSDRLRFTAERSLIVSPPPAPSPR